MPPQNEPSRTVLVVAHTGRPDGVEVAREVVKRLAAAGLAVRALPAEAAALGLPAPEAAPDTDPSAGCELALALGGDGTILRAAEITVASGTPVLGVNLGHVGFLAEADARADDLDALVQAIVRRDYSVEVRMTLDVAVWWDGAVRARGWALNEASIEKAARERMIEVVVEVDHRPLSRWGCDGVVVSTPTGSTAYAFSAGGPVVWPDVEALLLVPISAHALFARPMAVAPGSTIAVEVLAGTEGHGVLWCDGRRTLDLEPGARIEVTRGTRPVRLARLRATPFVDRLVAKFGLPVHGWRGTAQPPRSSPAADGGPRDD